MELFAPDVRAREACDSPREFDKFLHVLLSTYLPDDILTKVDRASMAVSLEVRAPMLDPELVEFVARIPWQFKLHHWKSKFILKKALEPILSRQTLERQKKGFGLPLSQWLREGLRALMVDTLTASSVEGVGLRVDYVAMAIEEHLTGKADHAEFLWALVVLLLWTKTSGAPSSDQRRGHTAEDLEIRSKPPGR